MPIFDANAYFAAKAAQGNLTDKFSALEAASAAKTQALEEHRLVSQQRAEKKALEQAAVDASWSGQLDLESGGFMGNRVNEAASLVSGASRLAGHITSLAPNVLSYMDTAPTTPADTEAWNRTKAGKALPEDLALLDRPIGPNSTVRKSFEDAEANRAAGRKVNDFFNLEKIVDPTHRNALTADLKKAFEEPWAQLSTGVSAIGDGDVLSGSANAVSGLAKLLFNTGDAVISNPTGVKEFVIENAPQLFVGALGAPGKVAMVASNVGYAADTYQQGIENYAKANGGALPPEAERQSMALKAASLALAEQAGDMLSLGAAKLGKKAIEGSADAIKSSFKESLKNIGKASGKGLLGEAPTEGYQTYMEGEITGKPATASDIYTSAVIGGIAGATLSGGGRAVAEVMGATPEKAEERQQEATQKQALQAAVSSGDISAYVDPTKGTYAPEKAVAALYGNSQLPDATPETKQANYEKAVNAVEELQDRRASIALIIEEETALEAEGKKSSKKLYEAQLSKADRQLGAAQESLNAFKLQMQPAVEEDEASITAMKQGDVEATDRMINLSMAIPERLSATAASELAESTDTQLTEPQRTYLRAFSEARVAENTLKGMGGVSEEIYTGSDKNVGIAQYRSRMADAVLAGNQKMADRQLKGLTSFVLDHQAKAQVAQEALDLFRETGKPVQLLSDGKGGWNINQGKQLSRKEVLANGGMTIHQGTPESLITNIAVEAKALSKAAAELDAAYAMKFAKAKPGTSVAVTKPVASVSQVTAPTSVQPTAPAVVEKKLGTTPVSVSPGSVKAKNSGIDFAALDAQQTIPGPSMNQEVILVDGSVIKVNPVGKEYFDGQRNLLDQSIVKAWRNDGETEWHPPHWKGQWRNSSDGRTLSRITPAVVPSNATTTKPTVAETPVETQSPEPTGQLLKTLDQRLEYMTNPPADYTTEKGRKVATWAQKQLTRIDGELAKAPKGGELRESLADARAQAKRLVAKAVEVLEGDESLEDFEGTKSVNASPVATVSTQVAPATSLDTVKTGSTEVEQQSKNSTAPEAVTATTEEATVVEQPTTVVPVESGVLTALAQKSPEGTPYQSRNVLADNFTQSTGREGGTALRPLVAVKDFMKALSNKTVRISDYLEEKARNLSDEQKDFIRLFNAKVREWSPVIQQNLVKGYWNNTEKKVVPNTGFEYRDLMQHLIQGTTETGLDLEENIKTALVYGAMRAVADSAEDGIFNSPQTINRMMQRDKDALVSETEQLLLGSVGLRENLWRNSVGQAAVSALGFKPNEDAPMDLLPRLESVFGAHIEKLLMDADILQRTTLTMAEMEELFPLEDRAEGEKVVPWKMLKLVRNKEGVLSPEASQIAEASKGTKNILDKLFGVAPKLTFPSLEPLPFKQAKAGGVDEGVPSLFVEVLNENQAEENFLRDDVWMVMSTIPENDFLEMAGMVDPETNVVHAAELLSVKAKNEGLAREYRNLNTFGGDLMALGEGELGDVPYYTSHDVWQTQRVGISDNGFNPQASKMHRGMYYKKDWKQTIELSDGAALDNFKVVVAESFGVKTDGESNQTTLDAFEGMVDPERATSEKGKAKATKLQAAIKVLQKIIYEGTETTPEDVQTLKDGVKAGGEKLQSLAALTDMAHLYQAQQTGATSFVTHLQAETDGKTNGIILSQLLFGGADSIEDMKTRMHRGGISFQGDEHTQFNLWKAGTGSLDQYESLTQRMVRIALGMMYTAPKLFAAVEAFTKPLELEGRIEKAGRDLTKNPLTTLMFGAKLYSAVDKMADKVIADIYKRIVEAKTGETQTPIKQILENLNTLLLAGKGEPISTNLSVDQALRLQFSPEQIKAIKKAFHLSLGAAAKQAISEDFDAYLRNRAVLDDAAKLVFEMSDAITKAMREDYIQELIDADLMPTRNGVPIRALSRKEEQEFKRRTNKLAPRVHTAGSLRDGKISNGVSLATSENVLSQDPVFQGNAAFGTPFKDTVGRKDKNGKSREAFRVDLNSNQRVQKAPRTGPAAKLVHSLDSATSHDAQLGRQVQNNHDALVSGVGAAKGTAEALNKALFNNLVAYSPLTEMLNSLTGMIQRITEVATDSEKQTLSDQAKSNLAEVLNEYGFGSVSPVEGLTQRIKNLANTAYEADKLKLTVLADTVSVDQYTREGGNYLTTPKDREAVQQKLNDLSPEVPLEAYEALDSLASMLGSQLKAAKKPVVKTTGKTPFGALGESEIASDKDFVAELKKRKQLTTKQIVYMLRKRFVPNTVNREILEKLVPLINPELKIVYIEKDSTKLDDASMPAMPSRGWYVATKEGVETIYVLGTEYRDSGVTPELFLHELLHAALAQTLRNPSKEAASLVAELEALLAEAANVVKQDPTLSAFAPAVSSIDELVSWGITNQDFQVKVLSKVRMPSKNKGNRLISGMKAFVETVAALLFRNPSTKQNHGLMVLVQNVSGLIASAEQAKPKESNSSAAFKRWFGGSKVVDTQGKPLRMYHGTRNDISAFRASRQANGLMFFTEEPSIASNYAIEGGGWQTTSEDAANIKIFYDEFPNPTDEDVREYNGELPSGISTLADLKRVSEEMFSGANVLPVYLSAQNIMGTKEAPIAWREAEKLGASKIESMGFDGVWVTEGNGVALAVVRPTQIKSAIGNNGNYDSKNPAIFSMAAVNAIDSFTTHDIFTALNTPDVDVAFRGHLSNLLGGIVEKLHGPYGSFKESFMKNTASNPLDVWLKALDTGVAPFASQALASGFTITPQEAFVMEQVEATMQAALDNGALTKVAYRELSDLYTEVRATLKVQDFHDGDWATASTDEQAKAKALHDFVFKIEKTNGDKSDYLARFAALGLAHQGFNKLLQVATDRDTRRLTDAKGFAERIQLLFEKVLAYFNGMVTGTYAGQPADTKLTMLVNNLVGIEAKKRHNLKRQATSFNYTAPVENGVKKLTEGARAKMGELAGSAFVRNSASGIVRGAGALARTVAGDRVEIYMEGLARLRNKEFKGRQGIVAGLLNDVRGPKELFNTLLRASKNIERIRKNIIASTSKVVLQAFANEGKDLSKKAKEAISAVFLRTGAHVLTMAELTQVLNNPSELQKSIVDTEKQLDSFAKFKPYFIKQANALAYYRASGKVKGDLVLMNAHSIARMYGTPYQARITEEQATQAEAVVDRLATLYALEYLGSSHLTQAANVLRTENQRTDGNGVEFVLKLQKRMEEESLARLFAGRKTLMMKGFTPEIYNPHTEIQVANEEEGKELVKLGYVRGSPLERDSADPDSETQHFYVLKDGGLQPHLTGIISYDGKKAKGTKKHNGYMNVNTDAGLANASLQASITDAKQKAVQQLFKNEPRKDLSKVQGAFMAPVLNDKGEVVNWRYLMAEDTKDTLLERDNRFEKILGVLAGSIYSKETTQEQNQKVVSALKEDYDNNHTDNNDAYVLVGPKSTDKEFREIWNLLPEDTKAEVRKVWGYDGMYVRSDSLDITFGYRKLSLSQIFDKDPEARNQFEKLFAAVIQWNLTLYARTKLGMNQQDAEDYAQRAGVVVARGERIWQELVAETKDIIVVKTGLVMIGNITSNLSLLAVAGVSMKDILQSHLVAMKGATSYQNDSEELHRYKMLLETGYTQGNEEEIHRNILRLEDAIARNPVKGLIDAGLMPTIVEDVAADEDLYSYKSAFARKTERFTNKLNDKVVSAGKLVYMTHDTKAYQLLSRTTQLSDFVARYTLYQHLTTRKENPLSHEAAIQEASDAFVNYDIPMHRGMQYSDDMGFTMFTKYFLRIQRVLLKLGRGNPARMLMLVLLNNYMDLMPNVLESSALAHLGNNPLRTGAFQFPGSLDDLATVNSAMSLLK